MIIFIKILFFVLVISSYSFAQLFPKIEWTRNYSNPSGRDNPTQTIIDADYNIYQVGSSDGKAFLLKYSSSGDTLLMKSFISEEISISEAKSISVDSIGNIYVVSTTYILGSSLRYAYLNKFSASGEDVWSKKFLGESEGSKVVSDMFGNILVGIIYNNSLEIIKYNPDGDSLWNYKVSDSSSSYEIDSFTLDLLNNCYLSYTREFWSGGDVPYQVSLVDKISAGGSKKWSKPISFQDVVFDEENNLFISDGYLIKKINENGDDIWSFDIMGYITDIEVSSENNILVSSFFGGVTSIDCATTKISKDGNMQWAVKFNSNGNRDDFANAITVDSANNVYIVGASHDMFIGDTTYIQKYSSLGKLLWELKYKREKTSFQHLNYVFIDSENNLIVAGEVRDSLSGENYFTMKIKQVIYDNVKRNKSNFKYSLSQNYPNPFNPTTQISYQLLESRFVNLTIYNSLGQNVATLVNKKQSVGTYEAQFNGSGLPSGIYYYRLESGSFSESKKMLLLK